MQPRALPLVDNEVVQLGLRHARHEVRSFHVFLDFFRQITKKETFAGCSQVKTGEVR